jgi:hypothetical protein
MNIKTKLILSAAFVALLSAPAAARFDGNDGGASAYPRFTKERAQPNSKSYHDFLLSRPYMR